jgi:hypothetical protein
MKYIKTLALFIILAVLASYVYIYEIKGGEEREKKKELEEMVFNFVPDSVQAIEIRSVLNQFSFKRTKDEWRITRPVETGGDRSTINSMLRTLKELKKIRTFFINKDESTNYGLIGRSSLATLIFADGSRDSLRLGDDTPVGKNIFASKDDSLVFTITADAKNQFNKSLFDWRNKVIANVKQNDIMEVIIKNRYGKFHFKREGEIFLLISPKETMAANRGMSLLLEKMEYGKARAVVSESTENLQKYRLNKPYIEIDLYIGESKAHKRILFSSIENKVANAIDESKPQVFEVDSVFLLPFDKTFYQFRHKNMAEFDKNVADSLLVSQGDSLLTFIKDTGDLWYLDKQKVKDLKMTSFLNSINGLVAKKFLLENINSTSQYGMNQPERKIIVYSKGEKIQEVHLNSLDTEKKIAYCYSSKVLVEIEKSTFDNLEVKAADFIEREEVTTVDNI